MSFQINRFNWQRIGRGVRLFGSVVLLWGFVASAFGQSNLKVEGMGFWQDTRLAGRLAFLQGLDASEPAELDASLLEDSAFMLMAQVKQAGYLKPLLELRLWQGEQEQFFRWESDYSIQLKATTQGERGAFRIIPGVRYYYESAQIKGVASFTEDELARFFIPGGVLFVGRAELAFTPENFESRLQRLLLALKSEGYRSARLVDSEVVMDDLTGAVQVTVEIDPGPMYYVGQVSIAIESDGLPIEFDELLIDEDVPLTVEWEQARVMELRNAAYEQGYPDTQVRFEVVGESDSDATRVVRNLRFSVRRGEFVRLGQLRFQGDEATELSVLQRQAELAPGEPINLLEVSEARRKLMALGIYQRVGLQFDPHTGPERDVVYELMPAQLQELRVLMGWGSYEMGRVGFNWEHRNPWGRAHRYNLGVKQSFKNSEANLGYTVPQFLGTDLSAYARMDFDSREELSYDRSTEKLTLGTTALLGTSGIQISMEYGISVEDADRTPGSDFESAESATVSSLQFELYLDRRDDFLAPSSGYSLFSSFESAFPALGGTVNFHQVELGGSYHFSLTESMVVHLGLSGGTIFSSGLAEENIPFNKRFFLGGENSVRGYREGGAAPLDSNGDEVGAEVYGLGNFELEQRIWSEFSAVLFLDALANARDGSFSEDPEYLYSIGLGIRYNTVVGPLRLEYGYNPKPDPARRRSTLHFSIGFPF